MFRTEEVLELVNQARAAFGDEPLSRIPVGLPGDASDCPIATAVGHNVLVHPGRVDVYFSDLEEWEIDSVRLAWGTGECPQCGFSNCVPLPNAITEWILLFDNGLMPEYVEDFAARRRRRQQEEELRAKNERREAEIDWLETLVGISGRGRARRFAEVEVMR